MDVFVSCQVLHPTGYLGTHHHQSLTNLLHLEQRITSRRTNNSNGYPVYTVLVDDNGKKLMLSQYLTNTGKTTKTFTYHV